MLNELMHVVFVCYVLVWVYTLCIHCLCSGIVCLCEYESIYDDVCTELNSTLLKIVYRNVDECM